MALKKSTTFQGISLPNGYHKISELVISPVRNENRISIMRFADEAARRKDLGNALPSGQSVTLPYNENMTMAAAYAYLKTLPEYAGAVDA